MMRGTVVVTSIQVVKTIFGLGDPIYAVLAQNIAVQNRPDRCDPLNPLQLGVKVVS